MREKSNPDETEFVMVIEKEGEWLSAHFPDLAGCFTDGHTVEELEEKAKEAVGLYLEDLRLRGRPIPEPTFRTAKIAVKAS